MDIAIQHLKNENQEDRIRENLKKDLKVYIYNADEGRCVEIRQQEVADKLMSFKCLDISKGLEGYKKSMATAVRVARHNKFGTAVFLSNAVGQAFHIVIYGGDF